MLDVFFGHFFLVCSLGSCNVFYVAFSIPFAFSVQSIMYVCSVCAVFVCKMGGWCDFIKRRIDPIFSVINI